MTWPAVRPGPVAPPRPPEPGYGLDTPSCDVCGGPPDLICVAFRRCWGCHAARFADHVGDTTDDGASEGAR